MGEVVLVTGATGYIGSWVVRKFLDAGFQVKGTVRDLGKEKGKEHLKKWIADGDKLELVQASLLDVESLREAAKGCKFVAHVASPFFVGCPESEAEEKLYKPARDGTLNVLNSALEAGTVEKVVITSSVAAIQAGNEKKENFTEKPEEFWSIEEEADPYSRSKTIAEKAAWKWLEEKEASGEKPFEISTVNPSLVIGPPLSNSFATSHLVPRRLLNRELPGLPDIGFGSIDVRDVADAHVKCIQVPEAAGNRFVLQSQTIGFIEWGKVLSEEFKQFGYKPPTSKLPYALLWIAQFWDKDVKAILGRVGKPVLELSPAKAQNILGMTFKEKKVSILEHAYACLDLGVPGFVQTDAYKARNQK